MDRIENTSPGGKDSQSRQSEDNTSPEGKQVLASGNEALENSSPTDNRSDEKVIVNTPRVHKSVNEPLQTAANKTEASGNDEEISDEHL